MGVPPWVSTMKFKREQREKREKFSYLCDLHATLLQRISNHHNSTVLVQNLFFLITNKPAYFVVGNKIYMGNLIP